jgi:hypothetical protein
MGETVRNSVQKERRGVRTKSERQMNILNGEESEGWGVDRWLRLIQSYGNEC